MRIEDTKLVIIKSEKSYTAYLESMKGVIVQTETLEDIPKKIGEALAVFLEYGLNIDKNKDSSNSLSGYIREAGIHEFHDVTDLLNNARQ